MESYTLSLSDELPVDVLPEVDRWSENYAFVGYDYAAKVGFAAYIGRWVKNPKLWREQLYLYLPDGTVLLHMAIGQAPDQAVPTAGALSFHCAKPGGDWRIGFDGAMRHERLSALIHEPIQQATPHPVSFDVTMQHPFPVWMFPASENTNSGKFHYEQMGVCSGEIRFGGQVHAFNCRTYRDHSRGPRHLGDYDGHLWLQLHFPGGPSVSAYHMWAKPADEVVRILDQAVTIHTNRLEPATLKRASRLASLEDLEAPVDLEVVVDGRTHRLRAEPLATLVSSLTKDFDFFYGLTPSLGDFYAIEQPFLFETEHGAVHGYLQRSGRFR